MDKINTIERTADFPWVFWIRVSVRKKWFTRFWKTRGSNYLEIQFFIFKISIGRPWLFYPVYRHRKDYGSHNYIKKTNEENLKAPFSFLMNKKRKIKGAISTP